jgi:hypothetical protein
MRTTRDGIRYWIFPDDYDQRIAALLRERPLHSRQSSGITEDNPRVTATSAR